MLTGPINPFDRLVWEPDHPTNRREVEVVATKVNRGGEGWVLLRALGPGEPPAGTEHWNDEDRVREACVRA